MISNAFEPDLLRAFISVCRHGSLSAAAADAGRAQSALSMQIRRLENLVGKRLLRRTGRGVVLTSEGEVFLGYANRILCLGEEAAARLCDCLSTDPVRIGLAEEIAITWLPGALGKLRRTRPDIRIDVMIDHALAIGENLKQGDLDIAIGTSSAFSQDAAATWDEKLLWVGALDVDPAPDRPLDVIAYPEPCLWRRRMLDTLSDFGRDFNVVLTSQTIAAIQIGVESGFGVALLTEDSVVSKTMRVLPASPNIPPPLVVQYGVYVGVRPSAATKAAYQFLSQGLTHQSNAT